MNPTLRFKTALAAVALCAATAGVRAQGCTNTSQYPGETIIPDALGGLTPISTCSFFQEYSAVGPVVINGNYEFTVSGGGYITVHEGTFNGPVIAMGYSPVTATATVDGGTLFAHWNTDENCGTSTSCQVTNVQFMLDCTPPAATVMSVDDCPNNQFSLTVNVTSLGDGTSVDLLYSLNGGPVQTYQAGVSIGTYTVGPFTVGDVVNLTVAHSSDPMCNVHINGLVSNNTCPTIINCGGAPLDQTYCYINNDNNHWHYLRSTPGLPLIIIFSAGTIESATFDHLNIYDGPDNTGTLVLAGSDDPCAIPSGVEEDRGGNMFSIAPNPAHDQATLRLPASTLLPAHALLVDALGRTAAAWTINAAGQDLDLLNIPAGAYSLTLLHPNQPALTGRLLITH